MRIIDNDILEYIHDAIVHDVDFVTSTDGSKQLMVKAECDEDCEYEDWAGKVVVVTFSNVLLASATLWGHVAGEDTVQSLSEGVSATTSQRITELRNLGISAPKNLLTFTLQSGSEIEIACDEVDVTPVFSLCL